MKNRDGLIPGVSGGADRQLAEPVPAHGDHRALSGRAKALPIRIASFDTRREPAALMGFPSGG